MYIGQVDNYSKRRIPAEPDLLLTLPGFLLVGQYAENLKILDFVHNFSSQAMVELVFARRRTFSIQIPLALVALR